VALVHDWLTGMRGGEKVLEAICDLYPDAPLFTLVHARGRVSPAIERRRANVVRAAAARRDGNAPVPALFPSAVNSSISTRSTRHQHEPLRGKSVVGRGGPCM
jgi:hypothetical protein